VFLSTAPLPSGFDELSPPDQLRRLERDAQRRVAGKLLYGAALQRLGMTRSAEKVYDAAARDAPHDVEARVAAAVGRFDKARPADAFSRLRPPARAGPPQTPAPLHTV